MGRGSHCTYANIPEGNPPRRAAGAGGQIQAPAPGYCGHPGSDFARILEGLGELFCPCGSISIVSPPCVTLPALSFLLLGITSHVNYLASGFAFKETQARVA